MKLNIVIFGLAITSSWGNGHAVTYRALAKALNARGHRALPAHQVRQRQRHAVAMGNSGNAGADGENRPLVVQ